MNINVVNKVRYTEKLVNLINLNATITKNFCLRKKWFCCRDQNLGSSTTVRFKNPTSSYVNETFFCVNKSFCHCSVQINKIKIKIQLLVIGPTWVITAAWRHVIIRKLANFLNIRFLHVCITRTSNFVLKIWEIIDKIDKKFNFRCTYSSKCSLNSEKYFSLIQKTIIFCPVNWKIA